MDRLCLRGVMNHTHSHCRTIIPYLPARRLMSNNHKESVITKGWKKFSIIIKTFTAGTKALYKDVRAMYKLQSKHGKYVITNTAPQKVSSDEAFPLTRKQLQFAFTTRRNLIKMLPTVALFFIPFFGYFVPLIAFMYPDKLLSHHFWTDEQKKLFVVNKAKKSEALVKDFKKALSRDQLCLVHNLGQKLRDGNMDWEFVKSFPSSSNQSGLLCSAWGLSRFPFRQQQRLERHMSYLFTCDWLLSLEGGVDTLSDQEVVEACTERRLLHSIDSVDTLRRQLKSWTTLTTSFKECPSPLMAQLPMIGQLSLEHSE